MLFNFSHKLDFPPILNLGGDNLQVVSESRILGLIVSDDLKWNSHVSFACSKARRRIWMLRRMMQLGLDAEIILDFYQKEIQSVLEYGAVVFHGGLTQQLSDEIESVQQLVLSLLSGYIGVKFSYNEACIYFYTEKLQSRRLDLCKTFVKRTMTNPIHSSFFRKTNHVCNTRRRKLKFQEYSCKTDRFYRSPLVYLTRLANLTFS